MLQLCKNWTQLSCNKTLTKLSSFCAARLRNAHNHKVSASTSQSKRKRDPGFYCGQAVRTSFVLLPLVPSRRSCQSCQLAAGCHSLLRGFPHPKAGAVGHMKPWPTPPLSVEWGVLYLCEPNPSGFFRNPSCRSERFAFQSSLHTNVCEGVRKSDSDDLFLIFRQGH